MQPERSAAATLPETEQPSLNTRLAGALLVLGALGFVAVFVLLARAFDYPRVLAAPAGDVLLSLSRGGTGLRTLWAVYAALPITVLASALLLHGLLARHAPAAALLATTSGALAGAAMSLGLLRWSTLFPALSSAWEAGGPETRAALAAIFDGANALFGRAIGELAGEVFLAGWLAGVGLAVVRSGRARWTGFAALGLAALMAVGSLRNLWPAVQPVTDATNSLLPLVLIALGGGLLTSGRRLRFAPAAPIGLVAALFALLPQPAQAAPDRELLLHGFRNPSIGVEGREGTLGLHIGLYPTTVDDGANGSRTTWFVKTGVSFYFLGFDTGSGRESSPFASVSLVQGLGNAWNVSESIKTGSGVIIESGFRWAATRHLDLRLGVSLLAGFDGRTKVLPTPGFSWSLPY